MRLDVGDHSPIPKAETTRVGEEDTVVADPAHRINARIKITLLKLARVYPRISQRKRHSVRTWFFIYRIVVCETFH